eukprot:6127984-Prymnesium_polylepis.1
MSVCARAVGGHGADTEWLSKPRRSDTRKTGRLHFHSERRELTPSEPLRKMRSRPESGLAPVMQAIARMGVLPVSLA